MIDENPFRSPGTFSAPREFRSRPGLALNLFTIAGVTTLVVCGNYLRGSMLNEAQRIATLAAAATIAAACCYMGICRRKALRLQAVQYERRTRPALIRDMMNLAFCGSWRKRQNRS